MPAHHLFTTPFGFDTTADEAELTTDPGSQAGVHSHALDGGDAARLWDLTVELLHPWRETI